MLRATWRCYDVDTEHCDKAGVGDAVRQRALCTDLTIVGPALLNETSLGPLVINGSLFDTGKPVRRLCLRGASWSAGIRESRRPVRFRKRWICYPVLRKFVSQSSIRRRPSPETAPSREPTSLPISLGTVLGFRSTGWRAAANRWPLC